MLKRTVAAIALILSVLPVSLAAQPLTSQYVAFIGEDDLYNSSGVRLSAPWQVVRQDRANFHERGIRQPGDEEDRIFHSRAARQDMETFIRNGSMTPAAAQAIMQGGATIVVRIYASIQEGQRLEIDVYR